MRLSLGRRQGKFTGAIGVEFSLEYLHMVQLEHRDGGAQLRAARSVPLEAGFDELLAAERFHLSFLLATAEKAVSMEQGFRRDAERRLAPLLRRIPSATRARLVTDYLVVPGLVSLMPLCSE